MKIRRGINIFGSKLPFVVFYFICFGIFLYNGLATAEAATFEVTNELRIPAIGLVTDVAKVELENHQLPTPEYIAGSFSRSKNKTLLFGHSSTVFKDLSGVKVGDDIIYNNTKYYVTNVETLEKELINMNHLLSKEERDTIVLMTCAGQPLENRDATHRLIITAEIQ